ncbi:MAG: alpha/beta fold hydrolase [Verrucomicrobiota bacterium]
MIQHLFRPEWIVCVISLLSVLRPARWWVVLGLAAIVSVWVFGTAGGLLFPAAVGSLSLLLLLKSGRRWNMAGKFLAAGGALFSALLCVLFPLPEAPELAGPHPVGTMTFLLPAASASPALLAQVWYPSRADDGVPRARWLPDPALAPDFPFHRIAHARARSREDVELLECPDRFPVIFYEHSWTGHRAENVAQLEALASQGFVIVAVDHPGQAERVRYPDGTIVPSRLPASLDLSTEKAVADFEKLAEHCLQSRIDEIGRVRRALEGGAVPKLADRLVLERVGIFGFSFGGTCALRACSLDRTFVAGANEDGFFLGGGSPLGAFLFFDEEMPGWLMRPPAADEGSPQALMRRSGEHIQSVLGRSDRQRVILDGTRHESFSDRIFTCLIPRLARTGTRSADEVHQVVTSRLTGFFKSHLTGQVSAGE